MSSNMSLPVFATNKNIEHLFTPKGFLISFRVVSLIWPSQVTSDLPSVTTD